MLHHGLCLLALLVSAICHCLWFELSRCLLAYIVKSICLCWRYRCSLSLSTSRMTFITASRGWSLSRRTDLLKSVSAAWSVFHRLCPIDLLLCVMPGTQFDDESWLSWPLLSFRPQLTKFHKLSHHYNSLIFARLVVVQWTVCSVRPQCMASGWGGWNMVAEHSFPFFCAPPLLSPHPIHT